MPRYLARSAWPAARCAANPERATIEAAAAAGEGRPILWLNDAVEVYMTQVQGSASVELTDGRLVRLAYDGRNGQPYTSIGRRLIESGEIAEGDMSLARLKSWLRANGLAPGERARDLMQRNRSYVFFKIVTAFDPADGPTGGSGVALTPLRSIAVDRGLWPYGAPFWLDAQLPWLEPEPSPFRRLAIAQGHRLGHSRGRAGGSVLRRRRRGGTPRRAPSAIPAISPCCCRGGSCGERAAAYSADGPTAPP